MRHDAITAGGATLFEWAATPLEDHHWASVAKPLSASDTELP